MDLATALLVTATLVGLYMAWNIGANDVANAMGTSVGSGALTLRRAIVVAAIFEFGGALLVGGTVTDTIRKGIVDVGAITSRAAAEVEQAPRPSPSGSEREDPGGVAPTDGPDPAQEHAAHVLALGMTCCLLASALWLNLATYFGWPVSTTHSIVGSVVGFGVVGGGLAAVNWPKVAQIAASWVVSPILGAFIGFCCFKFLVRRVLGVEDPLQAIRRWGPVFLFPIFAILSLSLMFKGLKPLKLDLPLERAAALAGIIGLLTSLASIPLFGWLAKRAESGTTEEQLRHTERVFLVLQVITACFVAFAHGSNDVANSVGPLAAVVGALGGGLGAKVQVPMWVLLIGAVGIVVGLATYGYKVMGTVGEKITELTPSRGFTAEFAAATTIVLASKLGLPVSTTHTLVGSVIGVALARGLAALNGAVLRGIIASWFITVPFTAVLAMILFAVSRALVF